MTSYHDAKALTFAARYGFITYGAGTMNTDKREAEARAAGTFDQAAADAANTGVTSGVHGAQGEDGRRLSDAISGEGPDGVPEDTSDRDGMADGDNEGEGYDASDDLGLGE